MIGRPFGQLKDLYGKTYGDAKGTTVLNMWACVGCATPIQDLNAQVVFTHPNHSMVFRIVNWRWRWHAVMTRPLESLAIACSRHRVEVFLSCKPSPERLIHSPDNHGGLPVCHVAQRCFLDEAPS